MRWSRSVLVGIAVCGVVFSGPTVIADDDDVPQRVTVSFGGGLNTAAPGNRLNHHVLPRVVKVRTRAARGNQVCSARGRRFHGERLPPDLRL